MGKMTGENGYGKGFADERRAVIVSRMRPFCGLTISLYLSISIFSYIFDPSAFNRAELFTWALLIATAALTLSMNRYVRTLPAAKLNAGLFSGAIVISIAALFCIYPDYVMQSAEVFAMTAFFISFIIPWQTAEVILVGAAHLAGYSMVYFWIAAHAGTAGPMSDILVGPGGYYDELIFLIVAVIICAIIRRRDERNDMEKFVLIKELEEKNAQMQKELAIARDIQKTLVPKSTSTENVTIAVSYVPLSSVGGDYATFNVTKEGNLFFLIGDVTGHGVPAALLVNRIYGEVESLIARNAEPGRLMRELDAFVQEHFRQTGMYFSVCSGLLDFRNGKLFYSNYGHPPQILLQRRDNTISLLESQTCLLGIGEEGVENKVFEGSLSFDSRDRIVLFTDGLIEVKGRSGEFYGMEGLEAYVKRSASVAPGVLNSELLGEIERFRSGPVTDDIFLVTIDIK